MAKSPILGGWSRGRGAMLSDAQSYNLILEVNETKDGVVPGALFTFPGLDLIGTLGTGPVRGVRELKDILYVISGSQVYSCTPNGIATFLGEISDLTTPVSMFANTTQLMFTDGVGAWLVPGGYPLTGGTISAAGTLYAVGDTIQLQGNVGASSAYPVLTVETISNNPVTGVGFSNPGSGYSNASGVATTTINGYGGAGTGFTLDLTTSGGQVTAAAVNAGGTGYAVNDTGTISSGGNGDAVYLVTTVSGGGAVTGLILLNRGTGYVNTTGATTAIGQAVPSNIGVGLTVNVTTSGGAVTDVSVAYGGANYTAGSVGYISGGDGTATYFVASVGPSGVVMAVRVSTPGATNPLPASLSQRSTSGEGSGFVYSSPTFGSWIGIVPVALPLDKPLMGDVSDGWGLMVFEGSQNIYASDQADLSTWNPLRFGVANQSGDNCRALRVVHNEVYVVKQRDAEVWVDQGLANFPFAPLTGVHIEWGTSALFSLSKAGDDLIFIGQNEQGDRTVVSVHGYAPQIISSQAVKYWLDSYPNTGDAIGYSFEQGGHLYYVLVLPEADCSWVYDVTTAALTGTPMWYRIAAWENAAPDHTTGVTPDIGGVWNRHWSNCYWPWRGVVSQVVTTAAYQPYGVNLAAGVSVQNGGLASLPASFATGVFSMWVFIPDSAAAALSWTLQTSGGANAMTLNIQNDTSGTPEIQIELWDSAGNPIVTASYTFTNWSAWVNIMVSFSTSLQKLQVYANTSATETLLSPTAITWASSNPVMGGEMVATLS